MDHMVLIGRRRDYRVTRIFCGSTSFRHRKPSVTSPSRCNSRIVEGNHFLMVALAFLFFLSSPVVMLGPPFPRPRYPPPPPHTIRGLNGLREERGGGGLHAKAHVNGNFHEGGRRSMRISGEREHELQGNACPSFPFISPRATRATNLARGNVSHFL